MDSPGREVRALLIVSAVFLVTLALIIGFYIHVFPRETPAGCSVAAESMVSSSGAME